MKPAPAREERCGNCDNRSRLVSVAINRPCPCISAASASVLPPAPAHRSSTVIPGSALQAWAINWLPISWISTLPDCSSSWPSSAKPVGRRTPYAVCGSGCASGNAAKTASRSASNALTRTSSGARSSRRGLFRRIHQFRKMQEQPLRQNAALCPRLVRLQCRCAITIAIKQRRQFGIVIGQCHKGSAGMFGAFAKAADCETMSVRELPAGLSIRHSGARRKRPMRSGLPMRLYRASQQ